MAQFWMESEGQSSQRGLSLGYGPATHLCSAAALTCPIPCLFRSTLTSWCSDHEDTPCIVAATNLMGSLLRLPPSNDDINVIAALAPLFRTLLAFGSKHPCLGHILGLLPCFISPEADDASDLPATLAALHQHVISKIAISGAARVRVDHGIGLGGLEPELVVVPRLGPGLVVVPRLGLGLVVVPRLGPGLVLGLLQACTSNTTLRYPRRGSAWLEGIR